MSAWEDDVRFARSLRGDSGEPYHQIRKWRRWAWFWFAAAVAGWWVAGALARLL